MSRSSPRSNPVGRPGMLRREAFTLVEILIAVAIVVFVVTVLAQIIASSQAIWRNSEARTDAFRDARAALELMARDLSMAIPNDSAPTLSLMNVYTQGNDATSGPQNNRQVYALIPMMNAGAAGNSLTSSPAPIRSDLCAVGYYCSWDATRHAYTLRRHVLESEATFAALKSAIGSPTPSPSPSPSPTPGPTAPAPTRVFAPSNPATAPNEDEDVAAYVWDFKVTPYEYDTASGTLKANNTYPIVYRASLPQFVEISFKAFSPQAAKSLESLGVGPGTWFDTTASTYKTQILPHMETFTTRIRLQNARHP